MVDDPRGSDAEKDQSERFEDRLKRLKEVVNRLDDDEIDLDLALKLFEEAVTLSKSCRDQLDGAELRIKTLLEDGSLKDTPLCNRENDDSIWEEEE